jgi:hypothetical protein
MDTTSARTIAERLHRDDVDLRGAPLLDHIARVARATPAEAEAIAWLHETLDSGAATEHELLAAGVSGDELRALRLLSWPNWTRSDAMYLAHARLIAHAAGWSGRAARMVAVADIRDRGRAWRGGARGWSPPYAETLRVLLDASDPDAGAAPVTTRTTVRPPRRISAPSPAH